MTNDTTTVAGALQECIDHLEDNLAAKGVTASYAPSTGMIGLIDEILNIQTGGSCYHIEFSEDSYVAVGGSATLEVYLQSNYQPLSGATVTVTGSDSSLYTGLTNSTGKAEITVSVSSTTTFTCNYSNVSDTCQVAVSSYIFYDACDSATGVSQYGNPIPISSSTTTSYLEYNSTENAYLVHANGDWGAIPIPDIAGLDNYKVTAQFKARSNNAASQAGFSFIEYGSTNNLCFRMYTTNCNSVVNDSNQQSIGTPSVGVNSRWFEMSVTKQGMSFTCTVTDTVTDAVVGTQNRTVSFTPYYCGFHLVGGQSYGSYVKEVKVESI